MKFGKLCQLLVGSLLCAGAFAQDAYPSKSITLVTPFAVGGGSDMLTRLLAEGMRRNLGQTVIVQNVLGAGGLIGAQNVAQAKPDGYTLLLHHIGLATTPALFKNPQIDPLQSFEPVGLFADAPMVIVGGKGFAPDNMQQLIDYVKEHKENVTFASSGEGSATHLCAIMFQNLVGTKVTMVQYKGAGPALLDVQAGRVNLLCDGATIAPHIHSGSLKAYVLTSEKRLASIPNLPTARELGINNLGVTVWYGLYAPAKTPRAVVDRVATALRAVNQDPMILERVAKMETQIFEPARAQPDALRDHLSQQVKLWTNVLQKTGIAPK